MPKRVGIDENLRFLILEVTKQVRKTQELVTQWKVGKRLSGHKKVAAKDDYIDTLKDVIQRKAFKLASEPGVNLKQLHAIGVVATNLERISDFCENIAGQLTYIEVDGILGKRNWAPFFVAVLDGLAGVDEALFKMDSQKALAVCRFELELDRLYDQTFRAILEELKAAEAIQTHITTLFIARYFERMGDSLLNIGEAILSASLGESIKIDQFWALNDSLDNTDRDIDDVAVEAAGESRSGCRIDRISDRRGGDATTVIFKEGRSKKVIEERDSIARWHDIMPGLAPNVYSFHDSGDTAAILFEFLHGNTFEEILLDKTGLLDLALDRICSTMLEVWSKTRVDEPVNARFTEQLLKRLPDVWAVHPRFNTTGSFMSGMEIPGFDTLVGRAAEMEKSLDAPFSVFIHGDFNVDNIIYNPADDKLNFIDLHRSRMLDYVQDVSVFMVSNHRLQVFRAPVRRRINDIILRFHDFAASFAEQEGDHSFHLRLALGLARSLATSTRFVLDRRMAKGMYLRARYMLERVLAHGDRDPRTFALPREALIG